MSRSGRLARACVDDPLHVGLRQDVHALAGGIVGQPQPLRPEPQLPAGFLAGGVQDGDLGAGPGAAGHAGGGLQHERRLADAGLAAQQHERPGHEAAAQDAVELADAGAAALERAPRSGRAAPPGRCRPCGGPWRPPRAPGGALVDERFDQRVPGAAGAALAFPAQERLAAGLADVAALGTGHGESASARAGHMAGPDAMGGLDGRLLRERLDGQPGFLRPVDHDRLARLEAADAAAPPPAGPRSCSG